MTHNSHKVAATQVSLHRGMDQQNTIYTYNGILLTSKMEENCDTCYNTDES